jgi:hypothetical protein
LYWLPLESVMIWPFAAGQRLAEELEDALVEEEVTLEERMLEEAVVLVLAELETEFFKNPETRLLPAGVALPLSFLK